MRTIDITTAQNVTIEYELASVRDRALAYLIDLVIVTAVYLFLFVIIENVFIESLDGSALLTNLLLSIFPIALFIGYQFLSESLLNGQSLGKKAIGIKVVRLDGEDPSLYDYLMRAIFHLVDTIFSLGVVAVLLINSSDKWQRLGDFTSNTTVIRLKFDLRFRLEDILRINTIDDYQPSYPQVKQLSEQDMLFVKTIISRYQQFPNEAHEEILRELISKLCNKLNIPQNPPNEIAFLKTLIKDYIVLTR